jgi:putative methyltransferase (TIGR04325 family)
MEFRLFRLHGARAVPDGAGSIASATKAVARALCPPVLWDFGHQLKSGFRNAPALERPFIGPFDSWGEAVARSDGWDADQITQKALDAALRVRDGLAEFEQDTLLRQKIVYSPTILAFLVLSLARQKFHLDLIDFGGGLATNYFQNRKILAHLDGIPVSWNIIERPSLAELGRQHFAHPGLRFFSSLEDARRTLPGFPEAFMFSGSLQCLEKPMAMLDSVIALGATTLAFDRLIVSPDDEDRVFIQCPDPQVYYRATYPTWCFSKDRFIDRLRAKGFELVEDFTNAPEAHFDHCGMVFLMDEVR